MQNKTAKLIEFRVIIVIFYVFRYLVSRYGAFLMIFYFHFRIVSHFGVTFDISVESFGITCEIN